MALEVPQHIHQRLVAVIDDLRNAVGQEAAKAFLTPLTNLEPVEFHPRAETCDDWWMEFINDEYTTDANNLSCPAPSGKAEDPPLRIIDSQTEADTCSPACSSAPSPHTTDPTSAEGNTTLEACELCGQSKARRKRQKPEYNILEAVVQDLPRRDLLVSLESHWQALRTEGIYTMPSREVFTCTLEGSSEQARRLQHHLILRHLDIDDDLYQWRRPIEERRNLDGYSAFFREAQAKQMTEKHIRRRGERSSSTAQVEYLAHIYADRTPKDYKRAKQGFQKDLRNGRRWSILIDDFVTDDGGVIPGLGLGFLLLCGPLTARIMSYARRYRDNLLTNLTDIIQRNTAIPI